MSAALQSWLDQISAFNGLLAAYVVAPHQPPVVRSCAEEFNIEGVLSLHRQVSDVLEVLDAGNNPTRKLRWIFQQTVVYFERRKDGAGMCLITSHDPWVGESDTISNLIAGFRAAH